MNKSLGGLLTSALLCYGSFLHAESSCCDDDCLPCACDNMYWVDAEYMYWQLQDSPTTPPLVTRITGVTPVTPIVAAVSDPSSSVVLGGHRSKNNWHSGGRFAIGGWFCGIDSCKMFCNASIGAEASYFFMAKSSHQQSVSEDGSIDSAELVIPFYDVTTNSEDSVAIAYPGSFAGKAWLKTSCAMQGADINGLIGWPVNCSLKLKAIAGFRYWNFNEQLSFKTDSPYTSIPTDIYRTQDHFNVQNNFYGGQIGIGLDYEHCNFFFQAIGKFALGAMCQGLTIKGQLYTNDFNSFADAIAYEGGYFALPTNIGTHNRSRFAVIPEAQIKLGYQFSETWRFMIGYTFLYANKVLWSNNQIDRHINPTQSIAILYDETVALEGEERPKALLRSSSFWAQAFSAGVEWRF